MAKIKKAKKTKTVNPSGSGQKRYKHGKQLTRKNSFVRFLRLLTVLLLLTFIGITIYHFRQHPLISKAMVNLNKPDTTDLNDIIAKAAQEIGVSENNYQVQLFEDHIYIKIGVDSATFDLPLVNSILTGKIQTGGGELVSAKESNNGSYHLLEFKSSGSKLPFLIKLHYGDYALPAPEIILIIDDFGSYHGSLLTEFCKLPSAVNFAILPNEPYYKEVMEKAAETEHDILIHIPMEPIDIKNNNPGNDAILVQYDRDKVKSLMNSYIHKLPMAIAANNHMGSLATSRQEIISPVLEVLYANGLFFIDSFTTPNTVVLEVAKEKKIQIWRRDLFLDDEKLTAVLLEKKLQKLKEISQRNRQIFVIGHCHSTSRLEFIQDFIDRALADGFVLSPLSKLIQKEEVMDA